VVSPCGCDRAARPGPLDLVAGTRASIDAVGPRRRGSGCIVSGNRQQPGLLPPARRGWRRPRRWREILTAPDCAWWNMLRWPWYDRSRSVHPSRSRRPARSTNAKASAFSSARRSSLIRSPGRPGSLFTYKNFVYLDVNAEARRRAPRPTRNVACRRQIHRRGTPGLNNRPR
jgi:hypothetical protein